jgi:hypothetical protein
MYPLTPSRFRTACVAALALFLAAYVIRYFGWDTADANIARALRWLYVGAVAPVWLVWVMTILYFALTVIGLIGAYWFWGPSRWLMAAALAVNIGCRPFLGLIVISPALATLVGLYGACHLFLIVASFWSPIAQQFERR